MTTGPDDAGLATARARMVAEQIAARGISNAAVLSAMREVPRHLFVPDDVRAESYADHPLQIGHGQTISQPYIVALMTELARPTPSARALEVGSGSGYQTAVLSRVVGHVFSVEIDEDLSRQAAERLARLGYSNVTLAHADGHAGWVSEAPFDIVLVTAAPLEVPPALVDQLTTGGRLVIPVGSCWSQDLRVIEKEQDGLTRTSTAASVVFVPMVGK